MIYDISPPIGESLAVWPGDEPFVRDVSSEVSDGGEVTLSSIRGTSHLGAHVDAPSHIIGDGQTIDQLDLERFVGPCQVIRVEAAAGGYIPREAIKVEIEASRVLLCTGSYPDSSVFTESFSVPSEELVDSLADKGVELLGVDVPSVDLFGTQGVPVHKRVLAHGMMIMEGLQLSHVPEGVYELVALPLRLVGGDGSPVRAILREI